MQSKATVASIFPPAQWRILLRGLLRECSYLPDPIARSACHDHVLRRFRRYHEGKGHRTRDDTDRMIKLGKEARRHLSVLQRANEGYLKPLESVLKFAYGRTGRRRAEMLEQLLEADAPKDSEAVHELVAGPAQFEDGWKAAPVIGALLRSQTSNPLVSQLSDRPYIRQMTPRDNVKNSWDRKMPLCRRRNIRRLWYKNVLYALYPPLPEVELRTLDGLLSKQIEWKLPKRRSKQPPISVDASVESLRGEMVRKVLTDGPSKDQTFAQYTDGRPHTITRRIMSRLWQRISCLVPRYRWDDRAKRHRFDWEHIKLHDQIALSVDKDKSREIFGSLDTGSTAQQPKGASS